jgi:N-acetylglucosamine-6-phosphate deacetylase
VSQSLTGRILTPTGLQEGTLHFGARIARFEAGGVPAGAPLVLPGFIDVHVHGGGGADTMDGPEGVRRLAAFHLRHGTTTLCPTTVTNPWEDVLTALRGVAQVREEADPVLPDIPGAHLEGPFINPQRLGAQPPFALPPTPALVAAALDTGAVRIVTLAPELEGALPAIRQFVAAGVRVSLGHTRADYQTVMGALDAIDLAGGVAGFTHLYNAMGGLEGRAPGAVAAALTRPQAYTELIFDLHHVDPGSFRVALQAKPGRLLFITDAIRAAGQPEGSTELGGQHVTVRDGQARLPDGTLAGSVLTLDQALRNARSEGLDWLEIADLLSGTPADYLGLVDRGQLAAGKRADIVVLDESLQVQDVYLQGLRVI